MAIGREESEEGHAAADAGLRSGVWLRTASADPGFRAAAAGALPAGYDAAVDWRGAGAAAAAALLLRDAPHVALLGLCVAALNDPPRVRSTADAVVLLFLRHGDAMASAPSGAQAERSSLHIHHTALGLLLAVVAVAYAGSACVLDAVASVRLRLVLRFPHRRVDALHAIRAFDATLRLDQSFLPALKGRDAAVNHVVNRYHFAMLNDRVRNAAFRDAIRRACSADGGHRVVLDIGAGTTLLSLYATAAGADAVHAVEFCPVMASAAAAVLSAAGDRRVSLHNVMSTELTAADLPGPPTLLVTETFDCCLVGEGCVRTIDHARRHLLAPRADGRAAEVIPAGAQLWGCLVESVQLAGMLAAPERELLGVRFPAVVGHGNLYQLHPEQPSRYFALHCARLRTRPQPLSSAVRIGAAYDFSGGGFPEPSAMSVRSDVPFAVTRRGVAHAALVWMELDMGGGAVCHTCPFGGEAGFPAGAPSWCWDSVWFALPQPSGRPVRAGETVSAVADLSPQRLELEFPGAQEPKPPDLPNDVVRMVSSDPLIRRLAAAADALAARFASSAAGWELTDASEVASVFPPLCAARGCMRVHLAAIQGDASRWVADACAAANPRCSVTVLPAGGPRGFDASEPPQPLAAGRPSALHCHAVMPDGLLAERALIRLHEADASGAWDAVLPEAVDVWAVVVESQELRDRTVVDDANVFGPRCHGSVAHAINTFRSRVESNIDMHALRYQALTERVGPLRMFPSQAPAPAGWTQGTTTAIRGGSAHAAAYCFDQYYPGDVMLATADEELPWNWAVCVSALLAGQQLKVRTGQQLHFEIIFADDVIDVAVKPERRARHN